MLKTRYWCSFVFSCCCE